MAFSQETIEQIGAWCFNSPEVAAERKKAWRHFFGEDDPRPVQYWAGVDETVSRERRFLGWFMFDYGLPGGEKPAEVAARQLYSGSEQAEAIKAVAGARYVFAVASRGDRRSVYLDLEGESFEVRSPVWAAHLQPHQAIVAHIVPVRRGYWLPGPGWFLWPITFGPGMRGNLKNLQTDPVSMERLLQGRRDRDERPEPPRPKDDTLAAAVARMDAWAREKRQPGLVLPVGEWEALMQGYMAKMDVMGLSRDVLERLGPLASDEELQEALALANNIWNNTPQPDRGGLSPNQMVAWQGRSAPPEPGTPARWSRPARRLRKT